MKVAVLGASGGSGKAVVEALLDQGHGVTALVRRAEALGPPRARLEIVQGDAAERADVVRALRGQEAVVVALGIRENPLRVRLFGSTGTPLAIRSVGTGHVVSVMRQEGLRRLVVQSSYGVGETRGRLSAKWRLIFALLLKPQIADTEKQEALVRGSGLDWTLLQPVGLTDGSAVGEVFASTNGETKSMAVARSDVGRYVAKVIEERWAVGQTLALSG